MFQDDEDEHVLLNALESGTLKSSANAKKEKQKAKLAAAKYLSNKIRVNLRLYSKDIELIKHKAAQKGLPYQTLISSVLHQYATNQLEPNKPI